MSLVGTRPPTLDEWEKYELHHRARLAIKPGISIIEQSYRNIELILVDDGSPDSCPQICEEYRKKDSRIKVIHKQNGGLSDARNAGMEIATGEWITFAVYGYYLEGDGILKAAVLYIRNLIFQGEHYYSWPLWYLL